MILVVMLGAGVGAAARYRLDRTIARRWPGSFPRGTFTINVLGAFVLGLIVGAQPGSQWVAFLGAGLCGGFTTFSTFSYETVRLLEEGRSHVAVAYVLASLAVGMLAAFLGVWVAAL